MKQLFTLSLLSVLLGNLACNRSGDTFDGKNGVKVAYFTHTHDVKARIEYKNGYADGLYESYYPSGKVKSKVYYRKGYRQGSSTYYYENGKVKQTEFFKEDHPDSTYRLYNQAGKLMAEKTFKDGELEGSLVEYYPDGKPRIQQHYAHGQLDGEQKVFYPTGKLKEVAYYNQGFAGTGFKEYAPDGRQKEASAAILIEEVNHLAMESKYIYRFRLSRTTPHDKVFLTDKLREGRFTHPSMYPVPKRGNYFEHEFYVPPGNSLIQTMYIVAKTQTETGKELVLTKELNVGIDNIY